MDKKYCKVEQSQLGLLLRGLLEGPSWKQTKGKFLNNYII